MNCENLRSRLSAYLDGELSGRDMLAIRSHLNQCPECARILEIDRVTKEAMAGLPMIEPPAGFEERLIAKVMAPEAKKARTWRYGVVFVATSALACAITLGYLRASRAVPMATPTASNDFENQAREATMAGWDPYSGGSPVITTSR